MKTLDLKEWNKLMGVRKQINKFEDFSLMNELLETIKREGDGALRFFAQEYGDGPVKKFERLDMKKYWDELPEKLKESLKIALDRLKKFHCLSLSESSPALDLEGIELSTLSRPINRVGLYVPAGKAPLPSTVLMGAVPARLAGVKRISACFAASSSGPNEVIMAACYLAGVDEVITVGGAQAIMALAVGTEMVPRVDLIIGPGGARVTAAKALVSSLGLVGIDMLAGPSEVCVVADGSAPVEWSAADILSQLEHGESSRAFLISTNESLSSRIIEECQRLLAEKRFDGSLDQIVCLFVSDLKEASEAVNELAPEHLLIQIKNPMAFVPLIESAGSIFIGELSSEAFGDYASGTNHILPTGGQARLRGGLSVRDFEKRITTQVVSRKGFDNLASVVETLADVEGLLAHKYASSVRRS